MRRLASTLFLAASLFAAGGCANKNCKNACDQLKSCGLDSSGFSCDEKCGSPDDQCAACLNDTACADIESGKCASDCSKATFTKSKK